MTPAAPLTRTVLFLADGKVVDELNKPTADLVLDKMRAWGLEMRKVTIKGLLAHKLRLALTSLAIVLGVTFISGTFVLTDTLHNMFTSLVGSIYQRSTSRSGVSPVPGNSADAVRNPLPDECS